jgi:tryptophan-rich sensory protein
MLEEWFINLNKPSFYPPVIAFPVVWSILYILMGVSLFMVVRQPAGSQRTNAILVWGMQLFLNFWWSIFFFRFQRPDVALAEIVLLWLTILWMILAFRKVKPLAAYLQVPYLLWVSFATFLNATLWLMNK